MTLYIFRFVKADMQYANKKCKNEYNGYRRLKG